MLGDKSTGQRSMHHILSFLNAWKESVRSGLPCFPLSPQGLVHVDPGWVHRLESALQLFVCQTPPPLPPCRLCEWARQTSWLRDSFGGTGERASGYPSRRLWQTLLFFSTSLKLFAIHYDRHKWFCTARHNSAHQPGAVGGTALSHNVIISREETDKQEEARDSATFRWVLKLCSKFLWKQIMWRVTHRIQIRYSHVQQYVRATQAFSKYQCLIQ